VNYLVDTNVISELRKGENCHPSVAQWFRSLADANIFLSVLTIGELRRGVESIQRRDAASAARLNAWLQKIVAQHGDRILPVDLEAAEQWGQLNVPDPRPVIDGLLAATALSRGMTLVTRNIKDIESTGVSYFNPFVAR
jgi:predicted nucleic acid-binding protein